jgi:hypothetical protein
VLEGLTEGFKRTFEVGAGFAVLGLVVVPHVRSPQAAELEEAPAPA